MTPKELFTLHSGLPLAVARNHQRRHGGDLEEVTAEAQAAFWEIACRFDPEKCHNGYAGFGPYAVRGINFALDGAAKKRDNFAKRNVVNSEAVEAATDGRVEDQTRLLADALRCLSSKERLALRLLSEGVRPRHAAERMSISTAELNRLANRARERLAARAEARTERSAYDGFGRRLNLWLSLHPKEAALARAKAARSTVLSRAALGLVSMNKWYVADSGRRRLSGPYKNLKAAALAAGAKPRTGRCGRAPHCGWPDLTPSDVKVLGCLCGLGPATNHTLRLRTRMTTKAVHTALWRLKKRGYVTAIGNTRLPNQLRAVPVLAPTQAALDGAASAKCVMRGRDARRLICEGYLIEAAV